MACSDEGAASADELEAGADQATPGTITAKQAIFSSTDLYRAKAAELRNWFVIFIVLMGADGLEGWRISQKQ